MGLGRYEEAEQLLSSAGDEPADFYTAAALGQWLSSQARYDSYLPLNTRRIQVKINVKIAAPITDHMIGNACPPSCTVNNAGKPSSRAMNVPK